jgi:hypothetical protein
MPIRNAKKLPTAHTAPAAALLYQGGIFYQQEEAQ